MFLGFTFILNVMIFASLIHFNKNNYNSIKTSVSYKTTKTETYKTNILITEEIKEN